MSERLPPPFPPGVPGRIDDPSAWYGPAMAARSDWIETLSEREIEELRCASEPWVDERTDLVALTRERFPLPLLARRVEGTLNDLLEGRGFVLWRGLPVDLWGRRRSAVAFYGLGLHLGNPVSQNAQGHVLGHVRDLGLSSHDPNVRIYQTRERQTFHTDSADLVGLLCLQTARAGGASALVSSATLYNEMRARRPDLAACLFEPLATDRRGEVPPGARPYFEIPVFNWLSSRADGGRSGSGRGRGPPGHLSVIYQRQYIDSAQRFADAPRLTPLQIEALDLFDALTDDPSLNFTMELQRGDMQFVHNHALLHDRTAFVDWPEPERRRHLLRLWLAPHAARELPAVFAQRYGNLAPGKRGGVASADGRLRAALD
ncbi:MAG TPA: TauD/TfdA family dioxygenase [Burkholderiaceae bacterium]|nr:TauD/TfdA family dioxygenase [Burkholderiaceae bacterium]